MSEAATEPKQQQRPLSPHLQIYKPQITTATSIFHRASGVILMGSLFIMTWALVSLATGAQSFSVFEEFIGSILGKIIMFGWTLAFFYHFSSGLRHLVMDTGKCMDIKSAYKMAYTVYASAILLTIISWAAYFAVKGAGQ